MGGTTVNGRGSERSVVAVCREFRELDSLSDGDCLRLVEWLREHFHASVVLRAFGRLILVAVVLVMWAFLVAASSQLWAEPLEVWDWSAGAQGLALTLVLVPGGVAALVCAWYAKSREPAALIAQALSRPAPEPDHALQCGYELAGLKPEGTVVTCPECGRSIDLSPPNLLESVWIDGRLHLPAPP